jgi:regulator of cell morphogenesis and NO signaling
VDRYHAKIRDEYPRIEGLLQAARDESGAEREFLETLLMSFRALWVELRAHLQKEEAALFPMVTRLEASKGADGQAVISVLDGMGREHDDAALAFLAIARATRGFRPPEGASLVLRELYERLDRFDAEFREHVRLENEILAPRARRLAVR